jgi:hypothetical protein
MLVAVPISTGHTCRQDDCHSTGSYAQHSGTLLALQFGTGLRPSDLSTASGYLHNVATWLVKQVAAPVLTGLKATPWSAVRDRLGLPRTASGCPLVDAVTQLSGHRVRKCDVLLNAIMASIEGAKVGAWGVCMVQLGL